MNEAAMDNEAWGGRAAAIPTPHPGVAVTFTRQEWWALRSLRVRYLQGRDVFSARELEHLRFLRWLRNTGRLDPN